MTNINKQNELLKNDDLDFIDYENIDIIKYLIDKYRSAEGNKAIDALLYSIYMGNEIVKEEQKVKRLNYKNN